MKKRLSGLIALAMTAALFTGCVPNVDYLAGTSEPTDTASGELSEQNKNAVSLRVSSAQMDQATLKSLSEEFSGKKYSISYDTLTESDAMEKLLKEPAAAPDVFTFSADQLGELVEANALLPVGNAEEVKAANTEASVRAATVDGQLYAFPASVNTYFLYYNTSKLTPEEVQSVEAILAGNTGAETNLAMDFGSGYFTSAFFYAADCDPFGDSEALNSEAGLEAAQALLAVASNPKAGNFKDDEIIAGFREGKLAAAISGAWNAESISSALGDNYACTKLPTVQIGGTEQQLVSLGSLRLFGVNAGTQHPEEALALANWLAGEDAQRDWLVSNGLSPTNQALLEDKELMAPTAPEKDDSKQKAARTARKSQAAIAAQGAYMAVLPADPQLSQVWAAFAAFGQDMTNQSVSAAELPGRLDKLAAELAGAKQ